MNHFVVLQTWAGDDADKAASRLATLFALPQDEAGEIVRQVQGGTPWQHPKSFDEKNAETINRYLNSQGFTLELIPADDFLPPEEPEEEAEVEFDDEDLSADLEEPEIDIDVEPEAPAEKTKPVRPVKGAPSTSLNVEFHGSGKELFKIMFVNFILTVVTLGIYSFWGKTKVRRYIWEHTSFNRDFFHYHGTGRELFVGFLIFIFIFGAMTAGLEAWAQGQEDPKTAQIIQSLFGLLFFLIFPALMVGAYRYRFSRSSLRNIRFGFVGTRARATFIYFVGYLLTILTLTLYLPFYIVGLKQFWVENSRFGNVKFEYSGRGRDLMKPYLLSILALIAIPALAAIFIGYKTVENGSQTMFVMEKYGWVNFFVPVIYLMLYFWWSAFLSRYNWAHTHFAGGTFKFTATGWNLFFLKFTNLILIVFTVGLGFPWAMIRERNFFAHHLSCEGNIDMNRIVQDIQKSGAVSEGGADVFDIPLDFG